MASTILAAGGVIWRGSPRSPEIAVIHRPHRRDWSLPKGKLAQHESSLAGGFREVLEETGLAVAVQNRLGQVKYRVDSAAKTVEYWTMRHIGGEFTPNDEADRLRWMRPRDAMKRLDFPTDCTIVERFAARSAPQAVVLLTRHAKAGKRATWKGADAARPLDADGRRQAQAIASFATMFAPECIYAATPLRCRQTVEPLAEKIGRPIEPAPLFSDTEFESRPLNSIRVLKALARRPGVSVVSSQGTAIPGMLAAIDSARAPWESRKGSVWALFFTRGELLYADYYAAP